jgi:hypothetical protein
LTTLPQPAFSIIFIGDLQYISRRAGGRIAYKNIALSEISLNLSEQHFNFIELSQVSSDGYGPTARGLNGLNHLSRRTFLA